MISYQPESCTLGSQLDTGASHEARMIHLVIEEQGASIQVIISLLAGLQALVVIGVSV